MSTDSIPIMESTEGATPKEQMPEVGGYHLGPWDSVADECLSYTLTIPDENGFAFLFGFQGRGSYFRLDVSPKNRVVALYQRCDGILRYLHHVCVDLRPDSDVAVLWQAGSIRVKLNGFCIINVIANGALGGHRGFMSIGTAYEIPRVTVANAAATRFEWISVGDGFSNNRWPHRHFLSWPEILFGDRDHYLNACVAAGNTRRVLDVTRSLGAAPRDAKIIVAAGTDDLIEGETFEAFAARAGMIVAQLRAAGAGSIYLCTLPPRASHRSLCATWSEGIRGVAAAANVGVLDFHGWLAPTVSTSMTGGDYPSASGQQLLAERIAATLGLPLSHRDPATFEPVSPGGQLAWTLAYKVSRRLEKWTLDYPGMLRD